MYWDLETSLCNESTTQIKVTDRIAYCTYSFVNSVDSPHFNLGSMPFEYSDINDHQNNLIWVNENSIYPGESTLAFHVSNHYSADNPEKGNLYYYDRNSDYGLTFAYEFGRDNPLAIMRVVLDSGAESTSFSGFEVRRVTLPYADVPIEYSLNNVTENEDGVFDAVEKLSMSGALFKTPLIKTSVSERMASASETSKKIIYIDKDIYDQIKNNYVILGSENPVTHADNCVLQKAVLYTEAKEQGVTVTDDEISLYIDNLKGLLKLSDDKLLKHL